MSYALALLSLIGNQEDVIENSPPLAGIAKRIGAETSTSDVPADKPLQAMIGHSSSHGIDGNKFWRNLQSVKSWNSEEFRWALLPQASDSSGKPSVVNSRLTKIIKINTPRLI